MSPDEIGEYINAKRPQKSYGRMTEEQARSISDTINKNPEKYG